MKLLNVLGVLNASLLLSGCVDLSWIEPKANNDAFLVAADSITIPSNYTFHAPANAADIQELGTLVSDSSAKCDAFLNRMVLTANSTDTSLDVASLALSSVGALVQPVAMAHIFSGASAFSSGAKTAVDSDVFARASMASYAQAIQSTYYRDMTSYANALPQVDLTKTYPTLEVYKIQSIHRECSLAAAQSVIAAKAFDGEPSIINLRQIC